MDAANMHDNDGWILVAASQLAATGSPPDLLAGQCDNLLRLGRRPAESTSMGLNGFCRLRY